MKFQLSTLLLSIGLVGVCVGWAINRSGMQRELKELRSDRHERDYRIYVGSATFGSVSEVLNSADDFGDLDVDPKLLNTKLVQRLIELHEHRDDIEFALSLMVGDCDVRALSRDALHHLKCDTPEDFYRIASTLEYFDPPEHYPELFDTSSDKYKSLCEFLLDTIAVKDGWP